MISFFDYGRFHGKSDPGSAKLRIRQLQKYWPEYQPYIYGSLPDVIVYQKVYINADWRFMEFFPKLQILDICDPDWMEYQSVKETIDLMDGVVCPTETMAEFLRQLTDKPVKVIPDRHDLELYPPLKKHKGKLKTAVWFGYSQNVELVKDALRSLERLGIKLTIISNNNPYFQNSDNTYIDFVKYNDETIHTDLQKYDVCILPQGNRPQDRFKSNNKTIIAQLCGLPVVTTLEELEAMQTAEARNTEALACYNICKRDYDVKLSVAEMKDFIDELQS